MRIKFKTFRKRKFIDGKILQLEVALLFAPLLSTQLQKEQGIIFAVCSLLTTHILYVKYKFLQNFNNKQNCFHYYILQTAHITLYTINSPHYPLYCKQHTLPSTLQTTHITLHTVNSRYYPLYCNQHTLPTIL